MKEGELEPHDHVTTSDLRKMIQACWSGEVAFRTAWYPFCCMFVLGLRTRVLKSARTGTSSARGSLMFNNIQPCGEQMV